MINWIFYSVPEYKKTHYVFIMFIMMVIVPKYLFGIRFTSLGYLMNFLLYDAVYYFVYQVEQAIKKNLDDK